MSLLLLTLLFVLTDDNNVDASSPPLNVNVLAALWKQSIAMRPTDVPDNYLLLRHLMTNYSKLTRPVIKANEAVIVRARLFPIKLLHMYEKNEVLEMTIRLQLNWHDPMLAWYPPDFYNLTSIVVPGWQLWVPDLQVANSVSDLYALMRDSKFDFKLHHDGTVWWHLTGNLVTRCELFLAYFPFDYQRCPIMLESAIYSHAKLNLTLRDDRPPVSQAMYIESGDWTLVNITGQQRVLWVTNSTAFTRVEFWIHVARKTSYFIMNIIFPCSMLSGLELLTFCFPLEAKERVPQATSILLSVIVFQTMIVDSLPRSSNSIPLLCLFVDMLTAVSTVTVFEAVLITSLVTRKNQRTVAPRYLHGLLKFLYSCKHCGETEQKVMMVNKKSCGDADQQSIGLILPARTIRLEQDNDDVFDDEKPSMSLLKRYQPSKSRSQPVLRQQSVSHQRPTSPSRNNEEMTSTSTNFIGGGGFSNLLLVKSPTIGADNDYQFQYQYRILSGSNKKPPPPSTADNNDETTFNSLIMNFTPSSTPVITNTIPTNHSQRRRVTLTTETIIPASMQHLSEIIKDDDDDNNQLNKKRQSSSIFAEFISLFSAPDDDADNVLLVDWTYLARLIDAVMFLICFFVVTVIPIVLFAIMPADS